MRKLLESLFHGDAALIRNYLNHFKLTVCQGDGGNL